MANHLTGDSGEVGHDVNSKKSIAKGQQLMAKRVFQVKKNEIHSSSIDEKIDL